VAVALSLLLILAACSEAPLGPGPFDRGGDRGGASGGDGAAETLVGTWRTTLVIEVPGDLQTWTTTWRFDQDGTCHQTQESESLVEGFPRTTERNCTFTTDAAVMTVSFIGGGMLTLDFTFAGFSPDRLVLDGFEYQRIA
jgi:hypothetical protein